MSKQKKAFERYQTTVLMIAGATLARLQKVEAIFARCLLIALKDGDPLTLEHLDRLEGAQRTQTLGRFISQLKTEFPMRLPDDMQQRFDRFLTCRNHFVHQLFVADHFDLQTREDLRKAHAYITDLWHQFPYMEERLLGFLAFTRRFLARAMQAEIPRDDVLHDAQVRALENEFLEELRREAAKSI
jgi:hypothetical protein